MRRSINIFFTIGMIMLGDAGCKKLVHIPPPSSQITAAQAFSTDAEATSAMAGVYYSLINTTSPNFGSGGITQCAGWSADEFLIFNATNTYNFQFYKNQLEANNPTNSGLFWAPGFNALYQANGVLAGLQTSAGVHDSVKNELEGEAKFLRAFINFYLVNLYGDIPLVTSVNWQKTSLLSRTPAADVYTAILSDLRDAQALLPTDYSVGHGERIIPNRYAAMALLARVYLYQQNWSGADSAATAVIGSGVFFLEPDPNNAFSTGSQEAIFQFKQDNNGPSYNATVEGNYFIPYMTTSYTGPPLLYFTKNFLNAFDSGDLRKAAWTDSVTYSGTVYYFPYKYKIGPAQKALGGPYSEYYMVLRLAEQYLIRAEAEAQGADGGPGAAVTDINVVRNRAGVLPYTGSMAPDSLLAAIEHERQTELFAEWGHRWFDLKRWGTATSVLTITKGFSVDSHSLLYPVPTAELVVDPNLSQNPGY